MTASTLAGFVMIVRMRRTALVWGLAVVVFLLPHALGAPEAQASAQVPSDLVDRFAWMSIATRLPFWLILGGTGGRLLTEPDPAGHHEPW